jgi:Zn2+/Cd2+-exporting ATPase
MDDAGVTLSAEALNQAQALQQAGKTLMWLAVDRQAAGLLALADTLRLEAGPAMKALKHIGVTHTIMLTGDNARSASAIAAGIGVTEFRADLMPADKLTVIRDLVKEYGQVAMIGDGVNDAPALANATVGIAMGGAGTDVALETADVALMGDDLSKLPFAVGLGRAARAIIVQNLVIALGVIGLLILTSLTGIVSMGIAVVLHEGSTLVVVANALRLLGYRQN